MRIPLGWLSVVQTMTMRPQGTAPGGSGPSNGCNSGRQLHAIPLPFSAPDCRICGSAVDSMWSDAVPGPMELPMLPSNREIRGWLGFCLGIQFTMSEIVCKARDQVHLTAKSGFAVAARSLAFLFKQATIGLPAARRRYIASQSMSTNPPRAATRHAWL
jgi:hypothetical protein